MYKSFKKSTLAAADPRGAYLFSAGEGLWPPQMGAGSEGGEKLTRSSCTCVDVGAMRPGDGG